MTWAEALEIVVSRTGHARFRELCADGNPDVPRRDAYRALVTSLASGGVPGPPGTTDRPGAEDGALRAYVEKHGCGGCGG